MELAWVGGVFVNNKTVDLFDIRRLIMITDDRFYYLLNIFIFSETGSTLYVQVWVMEQSLDKFIQKTEVSWEYAFSC